MCWYILKKASGTSGTSSFGELHEEGTELAVRISTTKIQSAANDQQTVVYLVCLNVVVLCLGLVTFQVPLKVWVDRLGPSSLKGIGAGEAVVGGFVLGQLLIWGFRKCKYSGKPSRLPTLLSESPNERRTVFKVDLRHLVALESRILAHVEQMKLRSPVLTSAEIRQSMRASSPLWLDGGEGVRKRIALAESSAKSYLGQLETALASVVAARKAYQEALRPVVATGEAPFIQALGEIDSILRSENLRAIADSGKFSEYTTTMEGLRAEAVEIARVAANYSTDNSAHNAPKGSAAAMSESEALEVLGLSKSATAEEIRKAWKDAAATFHVDRHQGKGPALLKVLEEMQKKINLAKEVLLKPGPSHEP